MIKVTTIGGYNEVGKNMTALQIDDDVILFDCGLFLPPIVEHEEKDKVYNERKLRDIDALPNDLVLDKLGLRDKVRAILISHAHLDHLGAVPYIAHRYPAADIYGTPYTIEVLKSLVKDSKFGLKNGIKAVSPNSSVIVKGKKDYEVEFINVTHSTVQAALIAVHTDKGVILYANDFKFDNSPIVGKKPNYDRLKELAKEGVLALIVDSLYSSSERKTPSEKIARDLLEDVLLTTTNEDACIIVTTFSSHIARLKSIVDCAKQLNRKILFIGRSLFRYVNAAATINLVPFIKDIQLVSYTSQVEKALKQVMKDREKYLIVCTGHQGEPGSVLDRLTRGQLPFHFSPKDHVIFASSIIPSPINIANRGQLEKKLKEDGVRIFSDVHVSGHCAREDLRDFIEMVKPLHIIPAHGDMVKLTPLAELATELGYVLGRNVHLMQNGQSLKLESGTGYHIK
jgi:ribonuclease J